MSSMFLPLSDSKYSLNLTFGWECIFTYGTYIPNQPIRISVFRHTSKIGKKLPICIIIMLKSL